MHGLEFVLPSGFDACDTSDSLAIANNEIIAVNNLFNFDHWPFGSLADKDWGSSGWLSGWHRICRESGLIELTFF